jgi:hypothetical protein
MLLSGTEHGEIAPDIATSFIMRTLEQHTQQ